MIRSRFVALPPQHVASSRLALRVSRAIVARARGWSLDGLLVSRRWRFQIGRSRWVAHAHVSFMFSSGAHYRGSATVFSIHFEGTGSASALERSALVQDLRGRLGKRLVWKLSNESRPRRLLAELDRLAEAFGAGDRHRAPPSRSRAVGKRLAVVADAVLARATWTLEGPTVCIWRDVAACGTIASLPRGERREVASMLMIFGDKAPASAAVTARVARAESRGYVDHTGKKRPYLVFMKQQPLSLRAALQEARFIEAEVLEK